MLRISCMHRSVSLMCGLAITALFHQGAEAAPPSDVIWGLTFADAFNNNSLDSTKWLDDYPWSSGNASNNVLTSSATVTTNSNGTGTLNLIQTRLASAQTVDGNSLSAAILRARRSQPACTTAAVRLGKTWTCSTSRTATSKPVWNCRSMMAPYPPSGCCRADGRPRLKRVQRSGVDFSPLSDSSAAERAYGEKGGERLAMASGVQWQSDATSSWISLADYSGKKGAPRAVTTADLSVGACSPAGVSFDLNYRLRCKRIGCSAFAPLHNRLQRSRVRGDAEPIIEEPTAALSRLGERRGERSSRYNPSRGGINRRTWLNTDMAGSGAGGRGNNQLGQFTRHLSQSLHAAADRHLGAGGAG